VATPVVVLTGVVPLSVDATVEPEPDVVVVVDPELEAVLDEDVVPEVVAAVCVPAAAVVPPVGVVTPDVRLITPAFGVTKVATELEPAADVAAEPLDPSSPPQAARVSVARVQSTTLRTCARTAKAKCVIVTTPVRLKKLRQGSDTFRGRATPRSPIAIRITTNIVACR
jgi:hypothetical protein